MPDSFDAGLPPARAATPAPRPSRETVGRSDSASHADEPTRVSDAPPGSPPPIAEIAARIQGYQLLEELHRGGQGVVYRAVQLGTKRTVALKVLLEGPFAGENARRRFEREIELAASLRHPNIVTILDSGSSDGHYYFAMEFIDGRRLDVYLAERRPALHEVVRLLARIADAINFAHQRGVIHRDLKPSNILIDQDGEPRILDFGLAKESRSVDPFRTTVQVLSTTGQIIGTVAYMSPEQAQGRETDVRSDVYALGVIAYEAMLGQPPYTVSGALGDVLQAIARQEPAGPRSMRHKSRFGREINEELETILLKALEKSPDRRYQTAGDLARDLHHFLRGEPIEARRASAWYMFRKTLRRYRLQALAAGSMLLMLLVFVGVLAWLYTRESAARQRYAELQKREAEARERAEASSADALARAADLRHALRREKIQRGQVAQVRGDLSAARDSFWEAFDFERPDAAARLALRQYYERTGDLGSQMISLTGLEPLAQARPRAIAPSGAWGAAIEPGQMAILRNLQTGAVELAVRTPTDALAICATDGGELAAAGAGWGALWRRTSSRPVLVALPAQDANLGQAQVLVESDWFFILGTKAVYGFAIPGEQDDSAAREPTFVHALQSRRIGEAAAGPLGPSAKLGAKSVLDAVSGIAVPTAQGVELLRISASGRVESSLAWTGREQSARGVAIGPADSLVVLSDHLEVRSLADLSGRWTRLVHDVEDAHRFAVDLRAGVALIGTTDGRVEVYQSGAMVRTWQVGAQPVEAVALSAEQQAVTLDVEGVVTRWALRSAGQPVTLAPVDAVAWTVCGDGRRIVLVDRLGRVMRVAPDAPPETLMTLARLRSGPGEVLHDLSISTDHAGEAVLVRLGNRLWLRSPAGAILATRWSHPRLPVLKTACLSGDGSLVALLVQTPNADEQQVILHHNLPRRGGESTALRELLPQVGRPVPYLGSPVRTIRFLPSESRLVVARANGEIFLLDPAPGDLPLASSAPWFTLDSPAKFVLCNHTGNLLAAACDDAQVRLLDLQRRTQLGTLTVGQPIAAAAFGGESDMFLARGAAGRLTIFDLRGFDPVAAWNVDPSENPVTAWLRDPEALLLGGREGISSHPYHAIDQRIEADRRFAVLRSLARRVARMEFAAAWADAERAERTWPDLAGAAIAEVAVAALRRPGFDLPAEWITAIGNIVNPTQRMRLGHAACDTARTELARRLLEREGEEPDSLTRWSLAECAYLAGEMTQAAELLDAIQKDPLVTVGGRSQVQLLRIAALVFAEQQRAAERALLELVEEARTRSPNDAVPSIAAIIIGDYLLGKQGETQLTANFKAWLTVFNEQWLVYRDDMHFFAGELERRRGRREAAITQYRLCIEASRDEWPVLWARQRLGELTVQAQEEEKEPA